MSEWLAVIAVLGLGLSAGALLAEAALLVPFWRSLQPAEFLAWYERNASRLLRFFGPLEVVPTLLVINAAIVFVWQGRRGGGWLSLASILTLAVLASFPIYFRAANQSFAEATIAEADVAAELARWSTWHWARVMGALVAFATATLAL